MISNVNGANPAQRICSIKPAENAPAKPAEPEKTAAKNVDE